MSEDRQIRYTVWQEENSSQKPCKQCLRKTKKATFGTLFRRRVTGRDGECHTEYKIVCSACGQNSGVYRSHRLAIATWEAAQEPEDGYSLPHRNRRKEEATVDGSEGERTYQDAWTRIATDRQKA